MNINRIRRNMLIEFRKHQDDIIWSDFGIKAKHATRGVIKLMQKYDPTFEGVGYFGCRRVLLNTAHLSTDCLYSYLLDLYELIPKKGS